MSVDNGFCSGGTCSMSAERGDPCSPWSTFLEVEDGGLKIFLNMK